MNMSSVSDKFPSISLSFGEIEQARMLLKDRRPMAEQVFRLDIEAIESYANNASVSNEDRILFRAIIIMKKNWATSLDDLDALMDIDWNIAIGVEELVRDIVNHQKKSANSGLYGGGMRGIYGNSTGFNEIYFNLLWRNMSSEQRSAIVETLQGIGANKKGGDDINMRKVEEYCTLMEGTDEPLSMLLDNIAKVQLHTHGENFFTYFTRMTREEGNRKALNLPMQEDEFTEAIRAFLKYHGDFDSLVRIVDQKVIGAIKRHPGINSGSTGSELQRAIEQLTKRSATVNDRVEGILWETVT